MISPARISELRALVAAGTQIPLNDGHIAVVDQGDVELVLRHTWHARRVRDGSPVYAWMRLRRHGPQVSMHRLIAGVPPRGMEIDHKNRNGLDNRRSNLRICTHSKNMANAETRRGRSGFRGVHWYARGRNWQAKIEVNGFTNYLGSFGDPVAAARAYDAAALVAFGEFARPNFPAEVIA